ncbi:mechanosensitive ion channel family protein [Cellulomonas sp. ATA003]|uniref:mechanosensitive ion channel family protein n=1 Tax=Cellulomonas sp. ATA003 TaxID=3073064 RepID=UPI0028730918|nr:mechanosensitive ion channel family protein [Cellulomonas sp. ATA003]WNB86738.1 mechanosensitive ion channel family protein [Cellulomonas sp. ATA003]
MPAGLDLAQHLATLHPARLLAAATPDPTSTDGPELPRTDDIERWFDHLITPAWQIGLTVLIGAIALALLRTSIAHTVRRIVDGTPTVHRHAAALLSRGLRQDGPGVDSSPLGAARRVQRAETMGSVLRSISGFVIGALVVVISLGILNVDVGPLLASAGVVGVALGFGAQTLVKDFLAGISMLVEDQYGVGDVIDVGEATGTVEQVGLRVTQIRSLDGTLWYVRNGEILRVGNMTQGWSRALLELRVLADEDVPRVRALMLAAAADVAADAELGHMVLEEPEVAGIEDLTAEGVMLRLLVKVAPSKQWEVARELRARIRTGLAAEGIDLALPRREVVVQRSAHDPVTDSPAAT